MGYLLDSSADFVQDIRIDRVFLEHTAVKLDPHILPVDDGDDLVGRPHTNLVWAEPDFCKLSDEITPRFH